MTPIEAQEAIDMFVKGLDEGEDEVEQSASAWNLGPPRTVL